ncbi:unnamed protein product [Lupinus luteus]|uniref:Uncharacterized protein n=1 Tax=Lupinus luteus TaxID=3873 RepID=A0AAV1WZK4_LUPLU
MVSLSNDMRGSEEAKKQEPASVTESIEKVVGESSDVVVTEESESAPPTELRKENVAVDKNQDESDVVILDSNVVPPVEEINAKQDIQVTDVAESIEKVVGESSDAVVTEESESAPPTELQKENVVVDKNQDESDVVILDSNVVPPVEETNVKQDIQVTDGKNTILAEELVDNGNLI